MKFPRKYLHSEDSKGKCRNTYWYPINDELLSILHVLHIHVKQKKCNVNTTPLPAAHHFSSSTEAWGPRRLPRDIFPPRHIHIRLLGMHVTAAIAGGASVSRLLMPITDITCITTLRLSVAMNVLHEVKRTRCQFQ